MAQHIFRRSFFRPLCRLAPYGHTGVPKQTSVCMSVWEKDRKSGYGKHTNEQKLKMVREGTDTLGTEMAMWTEEIKQKFKADASFMDIEHGDIECVWNFQNREKVEAWTVTADSDHNEGFSKAEFVFSKNNTAVFHGQLSKQVPKDGVTKRAGYCNIRSPTKYLSFKQEGVHDWSSFSHLLLRVRGDGRSYMLTITMKRSYDVFWHDQHHYVLFTHGGPYWQIAKIPFSKFYATSKGRIQDKQSPVQLEKVTHMGITVGGNEEGPFSLEIDSISVMVDESHEEQFAYE